MADPVNVGPGYLTQDQVVRILTKPLEARSAFLAAGPRIFDSDGSPIHVPKITAGVEGSVDWYSESQQITDAAPTFDELTLLPSTMKSLKILTRFSNEVARQSVVSLEAVLRDRLVADVASKLDKQLLSASTGSAGTQPAGILSYAGQSVDVGSTDALSLDYIRAALVMAQSYSIEPGKLTLMITPKAAAQLSGQKDADGRYQVGWDANAGGQLSPFGLRTIVTPHLTSGNAVLADWGQLAVARDLAPSVKVLTERYADYDEQAVRVVARYDAGPLQSNAIVRIKNINEAADPSVYETPSV